jgi:hypothetical protein
MPAGRGQHNPESGLNGLLQNFSLAELSEWRGSANNAEAVALMMHQYDEVVHFIAVKQCLA